MRIDHIRLKNFRGFEDEKFVFNPQCNVLIGENGSGKTTLLSAIMKGIGTSYLFNLSGNTFTSRNPDMFSLLPQKDVRQTYRATSKNFQYNYPLEIETTAFAELDGISEKLNWNISLDRKGEVEGLVNVPFSIAELTARLWTKINDEGVRVDLPVIAYFGCERVGNFVEPYQKREQLSRNVFIDGYINCYNLKEDTYRYPVWAYDYEKALKDGQEFEGTFDAFIEAIQTALPFLSEVEYIKYELDLFATITEREGKSYRVPRGLMSDGYRMILGMVAELACRCVILNGHHGKDAVKKSKGIVLIDEIDIHLHPNWQRHILSDFKAAFPGLQFIVTSHSPFIVQSVSENEILSLDGVKLDGFSPQEQSIGEIAYEIMQVESVHSLNEQELEKKSRRYLELLEELEGKKNGKAPASLEEQLAELTLIETQIPDPAIRALLKMNRKEAEAHRSKTIKTH